MLTVIVMIDLHAAEIDQLRAAALRSLEGQNRLPLRTWIEHLALDVQRIRVQRSFASRLRQPDGIEYAFGYPVFGGRRLDLPFASPVGGRGLRCRYGQTQQAGDRQQYPIRCGRLLPKLRH